MNTRKNELTYTKEIIDNDIYVCSNVMTSVGTIPEVYFCSYGLFIVLKELKEPIRVTYQKIRELLQVQHVYIYVPNAGVYNYFQDEYKEVKIHEEAESEEDENLQAFSYWYGQQQIGNTEKYDSDEIENIESKIKALDANIRGSFVDEEGNIYLKKGKKFVPMASINPDRIFYACVFGGGLGVHRFLLGKYFSGVIYFLTVGLFGIGWIVDTMSIFFGMMKEKKKRMLMPLSNKKVKMLFIPVTVFMMTVSLTSLSYIIVELAKYINM